MDVTAQLKAAILSQSLPPPSATLLHSILTSRNPPPPLPSLVATAKARLLACDLTSSSAVDPSAAASFPANAGDPQGKELRLPRDVHVQVVDVENLSLSRWDQAQELEALERGERTRGREVIRVTAEDDDELNEPRTQTQRPPASTAPPSAGKNATHRLVLQDRNGERVFALELRRIDGIAVGRTAIGEKVLLKAGTLVARGTVLLTPESCIFLGGRIEAWHKAWTDGRLVRLKETAGSDRPQ